MRIIAEVAQGYEGRPDYCDFYVRAAAKAGADAVKFQIVYADDVAEPGYQYYDWYRKLEMDIDVWRAVRARADETGVMLLTDVSGGRALEVAKAIRPDGIKIHSSNFFNRALVRAALDAAGRVFVSLGGIEGDEVASLLDEAKGWGALDRIVLLYGFQSEPTPIDKTALARLPRLIERFPGIEIGFMDHVAGASEDRVNVSAMAMALGAAWIEKHITLSHFLEVEDYVSALEPDELADYVATLRRLEGALGSAEYVLNEDERGYRDKSVKKLIAARGLAAGHRLADADLSFKRTPRIAAFAGFHDPARVLGRVLRRPLAADEPLLAEDLE